MTVIAHIKESPPFYNVTDDPIIMIQEKERVYVKHDQLFKELIGNFFAEFIEVFFPEFYKLIDFESIKPLSEELFTDLIDGENRRVDLVIEARLKGEETLIVIHVEPQSSYQEDFHERMFLYFSLLYQKYRKPILPIAVFSYDYERPEKDHFYINLPNFQVLSFNFLMLELKKKNWREYLKSDNPVAAALLSKMGYSEREKVEVKKEFLKMLVRMELDPARTRFIFDFFEQYLKLNEEEEEVLMAEMSQWDNGHKFTKLPNSYEERGVKKGIEQGIEQGIERGKIKVALEMLKEGLSIELIEKVTHLDQKTIEKLQKTLKK